jgi:peptide/nickel transport system substrate-binding protein
MKRLWAPLFWISLALAAGSAPACTRGKSRPEPGQAPTEAPAAQPSPASTPPAMAAEASAAEDWKQGKLPASVNEGTPVPGGELIVAIQSNPPSLNVSLDADLIAARITRHRIYESLLRLDAFDDPQYRYSPELAERWDISEDKKTYTFHLRKDVKWHDGQPFSARDVIATLDKVQDPTTKAVHVRSMLQELASYSAPDDHTVVLIWKRPYAFTLDGLSELNVQPAHLIAKLTGTQWNESATNPTNRAPVGTGPFKFVNWETNSKIVLARNETYWGDKPHLDRLVFRIVPEATVRLQLAERGEVDMIDPVTSEQWARMDAPALKRDWNRSRFIAAQYAWIGWNEARPMFADKRVRRALTMLVDRPGIIEKMMYGLPSATTCHFYYASPNCDPEQKPLPYDPEAAAKLLDEAGWKDSNGDGVRDKAGKPFRFVFMIPAASSEAQRWAAKIKEDMARVGIVFELQLVEWAAFLKRMTEHNFDASTLLWGSSSPRSDPTQVWHSSGMKGGSNYISYKNPEVDKLIEQGRVEFDDATRAATFRKMSAILHEEQPYTWMYIRPELDLLHERVKGAKPTLMWWQFEKFWLDPALRRK